MNICDRTLVRVRLSPSAPDFNDTLCSAIDDTIVEVLGHNVLDALYTVLKTKYGVTRDELPYRTVTIYQILETTFGVRGANTVGTRIAQKFYTKLGLTFHKHEGYTLFDYVEDAKTKLAKWILADENSKPHETSLAVVDDVTNRRRVNISDMSWVILKSLTRVAIISILPAEDVSNAELEVELKKRLKSKLFSVDRISILDDQEQEAAPSPPTKRK